MLRRWLAREGLPEGPADLLDALNRRIEDEEAKIGPSYLMTERVATTGGLERIWRHAILPLLEEQHYGSGIDIQARFGLDALRHAFARDPADPTSAPTELGAAEGGEDGA